MVHPSTKSSKTPRLQSVELLRILSAFGIVAYHAQAPYHDIAYSGLIAFLVLSPMLDVYFNWDREKSQVLLARSLLIPWVFWMVIYGVFNLVQHKPFLTGGWIGIFYGTSAHLWFLPFMFIALAILGRIKPRFPRTLFWSSTIIATALFATVSLWRPVSLNWLAPFPQWIHATPAILVGVVLGLTGKMGARSLAALILLAVALIVADIACLPDVGTPYTIGVILAGAAVWYGSILLPSNWNVQPVSACMMGVYLSHVLILRLVSLLTGGNNYVTVSLTFAISLGGVWMARRLFPFTKIILG